MNHKNHSKFKVPRAPNNNASSTQEDRSLLERDGSSGGFHRSYKVIQRKDSQVETFRDQHGRVRSVPRYMISNSSPFRHTWDSATTILVLYTMFEVPFSWAYIKYYLEKDRLTELYTVVGVLEIISTIVFIADFFANFLISVTHGDQEVWGARTHEFHLSRFNAPRYPCAHRTMTCALSRRSTYLGRGSGLTSSPVSLLASSKYLTKTRRLSQVY